MKKKSAADRYHDMDEKSSKGEWNDDFGSIVIDVFEKAVNNGKLNKTVEELIDEIETRFNEESHNSSIQNETQDDLRWGSPFPE